MKRIKAAIRLFHIWQVTGKRPFTKGQDKLDKITCPSCGTDFDTPYCPQCGQPYETHRKDEFYKGTFDSIPFLNDDAKRTFVHLILRPGYMIRDYIRGRSSSYLAPLTALIIFYAFLALVSSIAAPYTPSGSSQSKVEKMQEIFGNIAATQQDSTAIGRKMEKKITGIGDAVTSAYVWLHLDTMPQEVDTRLEQSVAAVESTLRSQGVPRFLGRLILLTLCIWLVFRRKYRLSFSASATTASYILCQFCFFMLFAVLVSLGKNEEISGTLMAMLMLVDFHQMFGISWKRSLWQTIKVLLTRLAMSGILILAVALVILGIAASSVL